MEDAQYAFGLTEMPGLPSLNGADGTYALNSSFANEFFFQCEEQAMPWEAALDGQGQGFVEASTPRLGYRKLFVWGSHAGGRHWQEFLSEPGQAYLEIQGGLAPTQVHGLPMPGRTVWDWTQAFGFLQAEPGKVHSSDWNAAWREAEEALHTNLDPAKLTGLEQACRERAGQSPEELYLRGSGWGALEAQRRKAASGLMPVPAGLDFPEDTLTDEQRKWLALSETGRLPEQDPLALPGEWMVQPEWETRLEESLQAPGGRSWNALLHLGVMRMERFDSAGAEAAWLESVKLQPSAWAYRNLAVLALRRNDPQRSREYYEQAWALAERSDAPPAGLAVEYLSMLQETGQASRGMQVYSLLPVEVQRAERIQILRGQFALALGDLQAVEEVLRIEYAGVREGETVLSDLWFELQAQRSAQQSGRALDEALRREVRITCPPPAHIDFRSFNEA
jgi:tetratricopeptide (TPR) repeat protein